MLIWDGFWLPFNISFGVDFRDVFGSALEAPLERLRNDLVSMLAPFGEAFLIIFGDPSQKPQGWKTVSKPLFMKAPGGTKSDMFQFALENTFGSPS